MSNNKVFVGNLSWGIDNAALGSIFSEVGPIEEAIVITDRDTGRSRGFGFVTYADPADAQKAIDQLNESEQDGRKIFVNLAQEKKRD